MTAEYKVLGDVAVITLTNPPVNGLGFSTRIGITDGLVRISVGIEDVDDILDDLDQALKAI